MGRPRKDRTEVGPVTLPAEDLSADDDLLSWVLVDQLGALPNTSLGVFPQQGDFVGPSFDSKEILDIVRQTLFRGDRDAAYKKLQDFHVIKAHLETKTSRASKERFLRHLNRYIALLHPSSRVEIHTTPRYSAVSKHTELAVYALRSLPPGVILHELTGSSVRLPDEWRDELELGDELNCRNVEEDPEIVGSDDDASDEDAASPSKESSSRRSSDRRQTGTVNGRPRRRDFSILWSNLKRCYQLFLGPARFMNHDCAPNVELCSQKSYVTFKTLKPIRIGDELTTFYGANYFGKNNAECLCETCERGGRGGFTPEGSSSSRMGDPAVDDTSALPDQIPISPTKRSKMPESGSGLDVDIGFPEAGPSRSRVAQLRVSESPQKSSNTSIDGDSISIDGSEEESELLSPRRERSRRIAAKLVRPDYTKKAFPKLKAMGNTEKSHSHLIRRDDEGLPPDHPRCETCAAPLHAREQSKTEKSFPHYCPRCVRHALVFDLPWPARRLEHVLEYPPLHMMPENYQPPRPICMKNVPSLEPRKDANDFGPTPSAFRIPPDSRRDDRFTRDDRARMYFRNKVIGDEAVINQLREQAWAVEDAEEQARIALEETQEELRAAREASKRSREEAKRKREAGTVKGTGVWSRYEIISEEEYQRREEEKNALTSGTRRGGRYRKDDGEAETTTDDNRTTPRVSVTGRSRRTRSPIGAHGKPASPRPGSKDMSTSSPRVVPAKRPSFASDSEASRKAAAASRSESSSVATPPDLPIETVVENVLETDHPDTDSRSDFSIQCIGENIPAGRPKPSPKREASVEPLTEAEIRALKERTSRSPEKSRSKRVRVSAGLEKLGNSSPDGQSVQKSQPRIATRTESLVADEDRPSSSPSLAGRRVRPSASIQLNRKLSTINPAAVSEPDSPITPKRRGRPPGTGKHQIARQKAEALERARQLEVNGNGGQVVSSNEDEQPRIPTVSERRRSSRSSSPSSRTRHSRSLRSQIPLEIDTILSRAPRSTSSQRTPKQPFLKSPPIHPSHPPMDAPARNPETTRNDSRPSRSPSSSSDIADTDMSQSRKQRSRAVSRSPSPRPDPPLVEEMAIGQSGDFHDGVMPVHIEPSRSEQSAGNSRRTSPELLSPQVDPATMTSGSSYRSASSSRSFAERRASSITPEEDMNDGRTTPAMESSSAAGPGWVPSPAYSSDNDNDSDSEQDYLSLHYGQSSISTVTSSPVDSRASQTPVKLAGKVAEGRDESRSPLDLDHDQSIASGSNTTIVASPHSSRTVTASSSHLPLDVLTSRSMKGQASPFIQSLENMTRLDTQTRRKSFAEFAYNPRPAPSASSSVHRPGPSDQQPVDWFLGRYARFGPSGDHANATFNQSARHSSPRGSPFSDHSSRPDLQSLSSPIRRSGFASYSAADSPFTYHLSQSQGTKRTLAWMKKKPGQSDHEALVAQPRWPTVARPISYSDWFQRPDRGGGSDGAEDASVLNTVKQLPRQLRREPSGLDPIKRRRVEVSLGVSSGGG